MPAQLAFALGAVNLLLLVVLLVLLLRRSGDRQLGQALRDELRMAREEQATMSRSLREEVQGTLERRLGDSFALVNQHLESVQRGLGEMQSLADGVSDLRRVLTNVKTRGTWGEVQCHSILEQVLAPDQYAVNVATRAGSNEVVEFAVQLPGQRADGRPVWLPIDSKFPQEDYLRLVAAADEADAEGVLAASAALARAIRKSARDIRDKYLDPPGTTDFAIMFLPTEGLYAEVLRQPGLADELQRVYRVMVAGPTTLAALLSSLRLGFRTLAIERRTGEMWQLVGGIRTELEKMGDLLDRARKQVMLAGETLDQTSARSRALARKIDDLASGEPPVVGREE